MTQVQKNILSFQYHEYEERDDFHRHACYDLLIDGRNLLQYFSDYAQSVTPFGLGYKDLRDDLGPLEEFRGNGPPQNADGTPFLICGECHDPGCRGVWGQIETFETEVIWSRFSDGDAALQFHFDKDQYLKVFAELEKEIRQRHAANQ